MNNHILGIAGTLQPFALQGIALVGEEEVTADYFSTVRDSMVTLLVNGVFLDDFTALVHTLIELGNASVAHLSSRRCSPNLNAS